MNGTCLGSAQTDASGAFKFTLNAGVVASGASLLLFADNGGFAGTYVGVGTGADMTGLALGSGLVKVTGASASALDVTVLMKSALGALTDSDILYTAASSSATVGAAILRAGQPWRGEPDGCFDRDGDDECLGGGFCSGFHERGEQLDGNG